MKKKKIYIYIYLQIQYVLTLLCNILHCNSKQRKLSLVNQQMKTVVFFFFFFFFFFFNLATGVGVGGRGLPSMLIVVVWLLLIGSNCILGHLYLCIFSLSKLLYFVMGLR